MTHMVMWPRQPAVFLSTHQFTVSASCFQQQDDGFVRFEEQTELTSQKLGGKVSLKLSFSATTICICIMSTWCALRVASDRHGLDLNDEVLVGHTSHPSLSQLQISRHPQRRTPGRRTPIASSHVWTVSAISVVRQCLAWTEEKDNFEPFRMEQ